MWERMKAEVLGIADGELEDGMHKGVEVMLS